MAGNEDNRGLVLQPRDLHLMSELGRVMRVCDRDQAQLVTGVTAIRRMNRRLLPLVQNGLLRRYFLGTTAGGRKALYTHSRKREPNSRTCRIGVSRESPEECWSSMPSSSISSRSMGFTAL
jgi:hypothetical protein